MGLGDIIHYLLMSIGITPTFVRRLVGSCRCDERRKKLNALGRRLGIGR